MKEIKNGLYTGERPLYNIHNVKLIDTVFDEGESPLKECSSLELVNVEFRWKYPMWYSKDITCVNTRLSGISRSGIWYTKNITFKDSEINVPKTFRRSEGITLINTDMPEASETLWNCKDITMKNVKARGTYLGMNSENIYAENIEIDGDYLFDGGKNIVVKNSKIISKDSFWNCENVEIYDSYIEGEYFGWNTKNIKIVNSIIDSDQGLCYIKNLEMINCELRNTPLSFELCENINAEIISNIVSVKNPISGYIHAKSIGEIILDKEMIDPSKTKIEVDE